MKGYIPCPSTSSDRLAPIDPLRVSTSLRLPPISELERALVIPPPPTYAHGAYPPPLAPLGPVTRHIRPLRPATSFSTRDASAAASAFVQAQPKPQVCPSLAFNERTTLIGSRAVAVVLVIPDPSDEAQVELVAGLIYSNSVAQLLRLAIQADFGYVPVSSSAIVRYVEANPGAGWMRWRDPYDLAITVAQEHRSLLAPNGPTVQHGSNTLLAAAVIAGRFPQSLIRILWFVRLWLQSDNGPHRRHSVLRRLAQGAPYNPYVWRFGGIKFISPCAQRELIAFVLSGRW
ncbi:hypothetical protein MNV49_007906 [Pseudohyphozyma bogoriensis]|nr:hypothetical protein MNV49_007906 [Pseudohyphozyma bogoriensis]